MTLSTEGGGESEGGGGVYLRISNIGQGFGKKTASDGITLPKIKIKKSLSTNWNIRSDLNP